VKTRTLILLAMACGLAILVAGGAFLWRVIAHKDELTLKDFPTAGQSQSVGAVTATVLGGTARDGRFEVSVRLAATEPLDDAAAGWTMVTGGSQPRRPIVATDLTSPSCAGTPVPAGSSVECTVVFADGSGDHFVGYANGGVERRWQLEPPLP
jgi:hypothetical protein